MGLFSKIRNKKKPLVAKYTWFKNNKKKKAGKLN